MTVEFPANGDTKMMDRLAFADRDTRPEGSFDWRTAEMWRPLRIQLHYFEYLGDPHRPLAWKRAIVSDWIANNPPDKGDGWMAYAASLRMVNWIKFFTHLGPDDVDERWLQSLYDHALWLENNLELHILANHYLKNAKALLFAGLFFSGPDAERWQELGLTTFLAQSKEQFLADGGHYERSPMYHTISLEDVLDVYHYLNAGARVESASTLEVLRAHALAGLDFTSAMLLPDGTLPLFNDASQDVGPSSRELYDYAKVALGYEPPQALAGVSLRALEASGYYVIRDARNMLAIDCGPAGPVYQPGGERVVVDTGVFEYENNASRRYSRSTAAHNTVQIDALEQSEMWDVFRVARRAVPIAPSLVLTGPGEATFTGAHDGFRRSSAKAIHHRTVRYARGRWDFDDRIEGVGRHHVVSRVHLRPGLVARELARVVYISAQDDRPVAELRPSPKSEITLERLPVYPRFGTSEEGCAVVMSWSGNLPATMSYSIVPHAS